MKRRSLVLAGPAMVSGALCSLPSRADVPVVKFGQSASLSGGQAGYGRDVRDGILAAFAAASRKGIKCELITLDDGGDKERCKANTRSQRPTHPTEQRSNTCTCERDQKIDETADFLSRLFSRARPQGLTTTSTVGGTVRATFGASPQSEASLATTRSPQEKFYAKKV